MNKKTLLLLATLTLGGATAANAANTAPAAPAPAKSQAAQTRHAHAATHHAAKPKTKAAAKSS